MSKEFKPIAYYLIRRGWYDQLLRLCDGIISKKGKDPVSLYWKAFSLGQTGNIQDALRQLEGFQSRRDLQYPVTLALLYFHKKASTVDRDAVDALKAELSVAEDVTKEAGLVLAARFALFTNDLPLASKMVQRLLSGSSGSGSAFEVEAIAVDMWIKVAEALDELKVLGSSGDVIRKLQDVERQFSQTGGQADVDILMARVKAKQCLKLDGETLNILNQTIATFPWFVAALVEKAVLLATAGEWDQALDTVQRVLDLEPNNIDALQLIAVHAFTQESQPHDALQKLEDLDGALNSLEPNSMQCSLDAAALFSCVCSRQPRALQICLHMLDRALKNGTNNPDRARVLCQTGRVHLMQGPSSIEDAMRMFREASKRDPDNVQALEGMIHCQVEEGLYEDAEAQTELLTVMHSADELTPEFLYLQAQLAKHMPGGKKDMNRHLELLEASRDGFLKRAASGSAEGLAPFQELVLRSPDFLMVLAVDFLSHMESPMPLALLSAGGARGSATSGGGDGDDGGSNSSHEAGGDPSVSGSGMSGLGQGQGEGAAQVAAEMSPAVQQGMDLLSKVLRLFPGIVPAYIELARCFAGQSMAEEANRVLYQCLSLQPHCAPALVAMAKVEVARENITAADRALEQALSSDFSIRGVTLFRLVQAAVRAQQGRIDEAITEMESLMTLPEVKSSSYIAAAPHTTSTSATTSASASTGGFSSTFKNDRDKAASRNNFGIAQPVVPLTVGTTNMYSDTLRLTDDDRVRAFVTLASLLSKSRRLKEANKILSEAKVVFAGTSQEVQVLVAASHLAVERKDFDTAIRMLDKIAVDSPTYIRAQTIKAEILLNHNRDKEGFTQCYHQLVDRDPSSLNFSLLGEAYLRILNPDAAVDALLRAHELDRTNARLRGRIGRAMVATHEYHRAVEFYEQAIREVGKAAAEMGSGGIGGSGGGGSGGGGSGGGGSGGGGGRGSDKTNAAMAARARSSEVVSLSHDLAKLYLKLGRAEASSRVLSKVMHEAHRDTTDMRQDVATLMLLAEVHQQQQQGSAATTSSSTSTSEVLQTYVKASAIQKDLLTEVRSDVNMGSSETVEREKAVLSKIHEKIGNVLLKLGSVNDIQEAEQHYREAVLQSAQSPNLKAMLGLARIHKLRGELEQCQMQCQKIISTDPSDEEATVLLSEVLFMGPDPDASVAPLQNLLKAHPNNYHALADMINLLRKAGRLEEAPSYLTAAEQGNRRSGSHAGLRYCQGLHARYTNDVGKAISEFNLARRDEVWGHDALVHMIELFLNPDQDGAWEEGAGAEGGEGGSAGNSRQIDDAVADNISAAKTLLKELKPITRDPLRFRVLESYCQLATRQKANIDKAMQTFIELLEQDQDYLPAVLGMATGFMVEKAEHKARNLLKRVAKMELSRHDGEDFEKANLLLAKFYVDKNKYDLAQDLCKRCLSNDKSCSQAWEILGLVKEKDMDYEHAAECYEKAWKLEFEASAPVGYKLAFSYLKCKKYVEAMDVCEKVLQQYPDYPKIKEEILKKAMMSIRCA